MSSDETFYKFNLIGKFQDPAFHRYQVCLKYLAANAPAFTEIRAYVETYFETQCENRKRDICKTLGGYFEQHKDPTLIFAEITKNGESQVLYFRNPQRFFDWVAKYFNYKDKTHVLFYKRMGIKAHLAEMERSGRSFLRLALKRSADDKQGNNAFQVLEVELFSEILPKMCDAFMDQFEDKAKYRLRRIKKDQFLQFGLQDTDARPLIIPAESFQFSHDSPGLLGFCLTPEGEIDLNNWYVTLQEMPFLNMKYVVFGRIISGMRSFWTLNRTACTWTGKPKEHAEIAGIQFIQETKEAETKPDVPPEKHAEDIVKIVPDTANADPDIANADPDIVNPDPDIAKADPDIANADPDIANFDPEIANADPEPQVTTEPEAVGEDPVLEAEVPVVLEASKEELEALELDMAATKVQCAIRGKQGRRKAEQEKRKIQIEKEENAAATKVQSLYRGKKVREDRKSLITTKLQDDEELIAENS